MQKALILLGALVVLITAAGREPVEASEGTAILSDTDTSARCFVASVLVEPGRYQVVMTCRDLVVPPTATNLFYAAWARRVQVTPTGAQAPRAFRRSPFIFLGTLESGKLRANASEPFDEVIVTSEAESSPSEPSMNRVLIRGQIGEIDFEEGRVGRVTPTPTEIVGRMTVTPTAGPTAVPPTGRSIIGAAFRVFLVVLVIIVIAAIVISVLQRRSASR